LIVADRPALDANRLVAQTHLLLDSALAHDAIDPHAATFDLVLADAQVFLDDLKYIVVCARIAELEIGTHRPQRLGTFADLDHVETRHDLGCSAHDAVRHVGGHQRSTLAHAFEVHVHVRLRHDPVQPGKLRLVIPVVVRKNVQIRQRIAFVVQSGVGAHGFVAIIEQADDSSHGSILLSWLLADDSAIYHQRSGHAGPNGRW